MNTVKTFTRSSSGGNAFASTPRIEIYFKTWCPYSRWALALLSDKGISFKTIDVTDNRVLEAGGEDPNLVIEGCVCTRLVKFPLHYLYNPRGSSYSMP